MKSRIAPGYMMLELTLDVGEERGGTEAEVGRLHPTRAQLFLHHDEPDECLLGLADSACRFEAHGIGRRFMRIKQFLD